MHSVRSQTALRSLDTLHYVPWENPAGPAQYSLKFILVATGVLPKKD